MQIFMYMRVMAKASSMKELSRFGLIEDTKESFDETVRQNYANCEALTMRVIHPDCRGCPSQYKKTLISLRSAEIANIMRSPESFKYAGSSRRNDRDNDGATGKDKDEFMNRVEDMLIYMLTIG